MDRYSEGFLITAIYVPCAAVRSQTLQVPGLGLGHFCSLMQWVEVCQRRRGFKIWIKMLKLYPSNPQNPIVTVDSSGSFLSFPAACCEPSLAPMAVISQYADSGSWQIFFCRL